MSQEIPGQDPNVFISPEGDVLPPGDDPDHDVTSIFDPELNDRQREELALLHAMPPEVSDAVMRADLRRARLVAERAPERRIRAVDTQLSRDLARLAARGIDVSLGLPPEALPTSDSNTDSDEREFDWAERAAGEAVRHL